MLKKLFNFIPAIILLSMFFYPQSAYAQLTGTKTIPGDYATIAAAITDLNTQGVGTGGVTFNVTAGYTENTTADLTITATGTAGDPIVFQTAGGGTNPLVTRTDAGLLATSTTGGAGDAVFRLEGTDYITFDGIDVATNDIGIEYGYLTHKPDGTNGCQFVTIKNCVINLTYGDNYTAGIYIGNGTVSTSSATGVDVTDPAGINSNITITGNTIQNVLAGMLFRGSNDLYDSDFTIGESGAGNIIQNFSGGKSTSTYGMYLIYVNSPNVQYNTIDNSATPHVSTLYMVSFSIVTGDAVCSNNNLTLANGATSSSSYFIYSSSNTCDSEVYENNTFASSGTLPSGSLYFIYTTGTTPIKTTIGNTTVGSFTKAGGLTYCYYNSSTPSGGTETVTDNTFSNISGGSSTFYGFYSPTGSNQDRIASGNTLSNISNGSTIYCMYFTSANNSTIFNNTISDITGTSTIYGLEVGGTTSMVYNNNIYGIEYSGTSSSILYGAYSTTGTDITWYNNFISDLRSPNGTSTTGAVRGFYISSGTNVSLYYNTVYLDYVETTANSSTGSLR